MEMDIDGISVLLSSMNLTREDLDDLWELGLDKQLMEKWKGIPSKTKAGLTKLLNNSGVVLPFDVNIKVKKGAVKEKVAVGDVGEMEAEVVEEEIVVEDEGKELEKLKKKKRKSIKKKK